MTNQATHETSASFDNDNKTLPEVLEEPMRSAKRTLSWSAVIGVAFFIAIPISSAVVASGSVSPLGQTRTVEAMASGNLVSVDYTEGDVVQEGSIVATLTDPRTRAALASTQSRLIQALAEEQRLLAERINQDTPDFSALRQRQWVGVDAEPIIAAEAERFQSNRSAQETRLAVLRQRIAQQEEQIEGLARQMISVIDQKRITEEEQALLEPLLERGLVRATRILDLRRRGSALDGQVGLLRARIAEVREAIGQTRLELSAANDERIRQVDDLLAQVQNNRLVLEQDYAVHRDAVDRSVVRTPVTGQVSNMRTVTQGAVIVEGDPLFDIVPTDEALVIEAAIRPQDIDDVAVGQEAMIVLTALPQRSTPRLEGAVRSISPDTYVNPETGAEAYRVLIEIDDAKGSAANLPLMAGMPAEVFLRTGDRTLLGYLLDPLLFAISRTFRET